MIMIITPLPIVLKQLTLTWREILKSLALKESALLILSMPFKPPKLINLKIKASNMVP